MGARLAARWRRMIGQICETGPGGAAREGSNMSRDNWNKHTITPANTYHVSQSATVLLYCVCVSFFFHISFSFGISVWCFVQAFKVIEGGQLICIVAHWWKCAKWIAAHWASVFDFLFLSKNKSIYIHQYCVPPSLNTFASRGKIISSAALSSLNLICAWHSLCLFLSHLHCEKWRRSKKIERKRKGGR